MTMFVSCPPSMPTARMAPYCRIRAVTLIEMLLIMLNSVIMAMIARKLYRTNWAAK